MKKISQHWEKPELHESEKDLEMLPDTQLPRVKRYKEHKLYLVRINSTIDADHNLVLSNKNQILKFIEDLFFYWPTLRAGFDTGIKDPPWNFKDALSLAKALSNLIQLNNKREIKSDIGYLEIVRYDPAGHFLSISGKGSEVGETVAEIKPDGSVKLLVPEEELGPIYEVEMLIAKDPKEYMDEIIKLDRYHKHELGYIPANIEDLEPTTDELERINKKLKDEDALAKKWRKRYEEASQRHIDKYYPPDELKLDYSKEVPVGEDIEEFSEESLEDYEHWDPGQSHPEKPYGLVDKLTRMANYLDKIGWVKEADLLDIAVRKYLIMMKK